ncbi:hypothetical protein G3N95_24045 [Paraburkholderia sp. Tr-20389]|uniref:hypothetical protein n=1 Tax=Paraburkholderia sp. Tr-20389 TaxID=2703903 RepID=UPI0019822B95|nr:hypothetical protein [Paraburkholderia sp. Tr-20389]MBN3756035.1 hypothetical protein [Paraburkholderia sp. Tr-20389]
MTEPSRPLPPIARAVVALIGLASLGLISLMIIGSFAGIVAIVRWLFAVLAVCPIN